MNDVMIIGKKKNLNHFVREELTPNKSLGRNGILLNESHRYSPGFHHMNLTSNLLVLLLWNLSSSFTDK